MIRSTLLCLMLAALVGCVGSSSQPPAWSTGTPDEYPAGRYLTAMGEGSSRELAEQRAYSALARVFEVNIKEDSADFTQFQQDSGAAEGGSPDAINRQLSSRHLLTDTDQVLEGAYPVEHWQHDGQHMVLVALERSGAEQRLRQQITQLDQQTAVLLGGADNPRYNPVVQLSALEKARQLQRQRTPLNRNLSVVSGRQLTPPTTLAELEQRLRSRLAALQFQLSAEPGLLPLLEHAVGQVGARVAPGGELHLSGQLQREPIIDHQGWYWLRGSLQLDLSNGDGNVIAQRRWPIKVSAQEVGMIEQRLRDRINRDIAGQLYQLVTAAEVHK